MSIAFPIPPLACFSSLRQTAAAFSAFIALSGIAVPALASETLLTVITAEGVETALDREALEALPQHEFSTETQWTWEEQSFSGPLLIDVLKEAGLPDPANGGMIEFVADDGYHAKIDLTENAQYLTDAYPIVTTRVNGEPFPLENNGPLWVMFPYDEHPELDIEPVHNMTVWQLLQIVQLAE
ncbi:MULTISPECIES: molybdopterin-dependent oxidoreductase [unclassified Salipiger]|uniref:molybdopterin-dependent oxidoreductase n=1 Tax=Salipiger sp. PrR002 TaxID=2706489 RepID=UPI0013B69295|nr:molybdopterin-dependent oxidoreductase [Salipiger sp. PrR002]NDW55016.1 molybdopterin-dependent oxidoreductase [Salipiger sp. PrR004]